MQKIFSALKDITYCLTGMDLHMVQNTEQGVFSFYQEEKNGIIRQMLTPREFLQTLRRASSNFIYEYRGPMSIYYMMMYEPNSDYFLILGPTLTEPYEETKIRQFLARKKADAETSRKVIAYFYHLPCNNQETIYQLNATLIKHLMPAGYHPSYRQLPDPFGEPSKPDLLFKDTDTTANMRRIEKRYESNQALVEAVKAGNISVALQCIQNMRSETYHLVRSPNLLRNTQNMCIILNTQLRIALTDSGIHPYRLDQLSGEIAIQIEKLKSYLDAERFFTTIIRQYCELAQEDKYAHINHFSRLAISYIKEHLSENLSVKAVAKVLTVNADYLSNQFHKEVGVTFIHFVNRERITQAARLLETTDMQIQHIAEIVGYNNTSYFAKQFAFFYKTTPGQYRQNPDTIQST